MRVAMLSDVHLDGPQDHVQALFLRFVRDLQADELWLLGDVFHRFWTVADRPAAPYVEVFEVIGTRIAEGLTVRWVPGNHDFALSTALAVRTGLVVSQAIDAQIGDLNVHAEHGDRCDIGWSYALTSLLLRGPLFALWVRLIGFERAWRQLGRLAGSAHAAGPVTDRRVVEAQRVRATELLAGDTDLVVMGHTHVPVFDETTSGSFVNLGAFDHARHVLVVEDARVERFLVTEEGALSPDPWSGDQ